MHGDPWGADDPDDRWRECEYCIAEPGENGSFYCEECCGKGGHFRDYDESDYLYWSSREEAY